MAKDEIFVGRKEELKEFTKVLEDRRGQAIIVVGNRGMGKTWLVNRMAKMASEHPKLKCGWVRYEVTPNNNPDSTMTTMLDNAFEAGQVKEGSFDGTKRGLEQWRSFLNVFNLGDLALSLRRDPAKDTRQQFLERLELISKRMPENGRAIFIIDPEKYMAKDSDQDWAIVVKDLPEKIKFIFAQRTEDALINSEVIDGLDNVVWIPSKTLDALSEEDVDELVNCRRENLRVEISEAGSALRYVSDLRKVLSRYKGHPYAVGAALDLVEQGTKLEELPKKAEPVKFAELQWKKLCDESGTEANRLFKAYAILEVAVPDDIVRPVSNIDVDMMQCLLANKFIAGLLREEAGGRRIYHSILADYILGQMSDAEKKEYHKRAAEVYRGKLKRAEEIKTKPDELSAVRLPEHVLMCEGNKGFVKALLDEVSIALTTLGHFEAVIEFCKRALSFEENKAREKIRVLILMAYALDSRGDLDTTIEILQRVIEECEEGEYLKSMAIAYGNLGVTYQKKGEGTKAEKMHKKALAINKKLGYKKGIVCEYTNLSILYTGREDFKRAEHMLEKAQETMKKVDRHIICATYVNLGLMWKKKGPEGNKRAENMFRKALERYETMGDVEGKAACCFNLGTVLCVQGELQEAENMLEKSLKYYEAIGNKKMCSEVISILRPICHVNKKIVDSAEKHTILNEILRYAQNVSKGV